MEDAQMKKGWNHTETGVVFVGRDGVVKPWTGDFEAEDSPVRLFTGNNLDWMKLLPDNSVDSIVTDSPYGLSKEPDMMEVLRCWMNGEPYLHKSNEGQRRCLGTR